MVGWGLYNIVVTCKGGAPVATVGLEFPPPPNVSNFIAIYTLPTPIPFAS